MEGSEFFRTNFTYIAEIYAKFSQDQSSVDPSWQSFFATLKEDDRTILADAVGATWGKQKLSVIGKKCELASFPPSEWADFDKQTGKKSAPKPAEKTTTIPAVSSIEHKFEKLCYGYRNFGHLSSNLDPLGFQPKPRHTSISDNALSDSELASDVTFASKKYTARDAISTLEKLYCNSIGLEISHIKSSTEYRWLLQNYEENTGTFTEPQYKKILSEVTRSEMFEQQLHTKFPGAKRFSIEGGEGTIVAMEQILLQSSDLGASEVVIGMAHRGRLNVLTHVLGKPYHAMFSEFMGTYSIPEGTPGAGDVKYHLGFSKSRTLENGKTVYVTLTPNPSHLEAVNPVVMGRVRARQDLNNSSKESVIPILIHGDAAMAGQGIVSECLAMANLEGYTVGGTIHIVINNQIGFTATQRDTKSSTYCTDVAKAIDAPIFHVNGNDIIAIAKVARLATKYRQEFKKDTVIEIFCYRKYGHNEGDEPLFTQPVMYDTIKQIQNPAELFASSLANAGIIQNQYFETLKNEIKSELDAAFEVAKTYKPTKADWLDGKWSKIKRLESASELFETKNTGISQKTFDLVGGAISQVPSNFNINPKIARLLKERESALLTGKNIDWATGELLCYGSLVSEGIPVRLSGEDCERGTFSHRHSVYYDQKTNSKHYPLNNIACEKQAKFSVYNSLLSEFAVLGYEYGYSVTDPNQLNIWEAQFGDFSNGAATIYDQFISSGEDKWLRMSGLVSLLPHGFEGQGPEHSSARLERFLQYCAKNNIIVANCTTPANLFHILRRQFKATFRKPLVIMSPKSLLRHSMVVSKMEDFLEGSSFKQFIFDETPSIHKTAKKIILTSGKIYYELFDARQKAEKQNDIAIIRIEQYYPFDSTSLQAELAKFKSAKQILWCQEEPKNMGAWSFLRDYLEDISEIKIRYCGRSEAASPATGFASVHAKEQDKILKDAIS